MCNCKVIMNTTAFWYCNVLPITWMLFQIQWWLSVLLGLCNFLSILCLKRLVEQLFYITVEATKMCLKLKNLPKNGWNIHLDTLHGLRKGGSSNSRQLVYSKKWFMSWLSIVEKENLEISHPTMSWNIFHILNMVLHVIYGI